MTIFKCKTISISKYSSYVVTMLNTERKYEQLICLINGPNCRVLVARERRRPDWTRLEKVRSNFVLWWLISHQIIDLYNISDIKIHFIIGCCVKFWIKIRLINYIYQELTAVLFDCARPVCTLDQHFFSAVFGIHYRQKIWNIWKPPWKHTYLTFWYGGNGLAFNVNLTLTCSVMDECPGTYLFNISPKRSNNFQSIHHCIANLCECCVYSVICYLHPAFVFNTHNIPIDSQCDDGYACWHHVFPFRITKALSEIFHTLQIVLIFRSLRGNIFFYVILHWCTTHNKMTTISPKMFNRVFSGGQSFNNLCALWSLWFRWNTGEMGGYVMGIWSTNMNIIFLIVAGACCMAVPSHYLKQC